ncbi:MAG: hypothetical protein HY301_04645 [Verrucomicrobia bacterium]|nr:hypothetical protein [Verrucomicrobiota bacterium]
MTAEVSPARCANFFRRAGVLLLPLLLAGCDEPKITSYRAPKDAPAPVAASADGARDAEAMPAPPRARPQLSWTLPAGWKEAGPGRMSIASFTITGEGGKQAQVTITPLPPLGGREAAVVNMWREQAGQPELSEEEAAKQLQPVEVGGETGKLFEVSTKGEGTNAPMRIVTAMVHRADASWFYKLSGDVAVVEAQRPAFVEFLKSIRIKEAPAETAEAPAASSSFKWKVPDGWQSVTPGQMQDAKFSVPANGAAKADVTVSIFPSDTGGTLGNVTRWRRQIGLGEISEADLAKLVTPLDPANSGAMLVDMTNGGKQLIGAIVPRGGRWFFYKLLGDEAAVAPQKEMFVAFVKSEP